MSTPQSGWTCPTSLNSHASSGAGKRSFQKAQRRAIRFGSCVYRGHTLTPKQLGCKQAQPANTPTSSGPRSTSLPKHPGQKARAKRVQFMSWNVGGLSQGMLEEIVTYLIQHRITICILQETRWRASREWMIRRDNHELAIIHSGNDTVHAGVMIIIDLTLLDMAGKKYDLIRWSDPIPGRLLHVQLPLQSHQYADLIACYHKRCASGADEASHLTREQTWEQLYLVMSRCSQRNYFLAGIDLNLPLTTLLPWIGTSCPPARHQKHHDTSSLHDYVRDHDLCAANTWTGGQGNYSMYGPFQRRTLIDVVLMRRGHCDDVARMTCSHPACPLGRERGDPSWHCPIRGSFSTYWRPWDSKRSPKPGAVFNLDQLSADYRQHSQRLQDAQAAIGQKLSGTSHTPTSLNDCVSQVVGKYYPVHSTENPTGKAICNPMYATKWRLWKALRRPCGISPQAIILRWHMIARFYSLSRACKVEARRRKACRIDDIFHAKQLSHMTSGCFTEQSGSLLQRNPESVSN